MWESSGCSPRSFCGKGIRRRVRDRIGIRCRDDSKNLIRFVFDFELEDSKVRVWPIFVDDESLANSVRSVLDSWSKATCRLSSTHRWRCMDLYSVGSADRFASSVRSLSTASLASDARALRVDVDFFNASRWSSSGSCWIPQCWKDSANACSDVEYRANRRRRKSSFPRIYWEALIAVGKDAICRPGVLEVTSMLKIRISNNKGWTWTRYKLYIVTDWYWRGGAGKLVRSYSKKKTSSSRYSTPVKWALYLEDMSIILFPFHLVRENIEQLASTNGMFEFAGSVIK